ncbi:S-layer homology domain-containing protein [Cohnella zeiphila]|uniref:S-layer homology domain-containing protein n=1 Tax=Cohnella zeiphila TaxID=2761120 RepID=A0A7X0SQ60_9BACL|nr:S-layer homology domain-containing protein [Cohnella zeiphila]MBB6731853.1 S-layer homology domain-containing protein [Cohnella zeiphila]
MKRTSHRAAVGILFAALAFGAWSLPSFAPGAAAAGEDASAPQAESGVTVQASADPATRQVRLYGTLSSGEGGAVTVKVLDAAGSVVYLDQAISGSGGAYQFIYELDADAEGTYRVQVGGTGVPAPVQTEFTYTKPQDPPPPSNGGGDTGTAPVVVGGGSRVEAGGEGILIGQPRLDGASGQAVLDIRAEDLEAARNQAVPDRSGVRTVTIQVKPLEGAHAYVQRVPAAAISSASPNTRYRFETGAGSFTVPADMLSSEEVRPGDTVDLIIRPVERSDLPSSLREQIGDRPVVEIVVAVNGNARAWSHPGAPVTVSIPYRPAGEELAHSEQIVVLYLDESGAAVPVTSGRYDDRTGEVVFETSHLSRYAVAYASKTFADLTHAEWARHPIEVLAAKGVVNGTSDTVFSPDTRITREDFIAMLVRTLGLTAEVTGNFADLRPGDYAYEAVGVAKALGIAQGIGDSRFHPKESITRQDMMTLTARALTKFRDLPSAEPASTLEPFRDRADVAGYAADAVAALVQKGLIEGAAGRLNPTGPATRAEAAVFLYRVYNL